VKSGDFPLDKPAGDPCTNLDEHDACSIHSGLRNHGFKGCTAFDCFGAGQKVSQRTFGGRSWRDDPSTRAEMFDTFPVVRRLHELLWYLDEAIVLVEPKHDPTPWRTAFEHVQNLSNQPSERLVALDVDHEFDAVRSLLIDASKIARNAFLPEGEERRGRPPGPGSNLAGARMNGADLRGLSLRGSNAIAADFSHARLQRCDLLGVDLRDANLSGANLAGAIYLTQMQVNSANGDATTVLPAGFSRPSHWSAAD
jgi:hypothetical protein